MRRAFGAVALLAAIVLLPRAALVGLAGDYVDPIGRITAQDEALYAHSAIVMAERGDWLTPRFLGRLALYKPPLLMWAAGISAKLFGVEPLTLRLPVLLTAAFAVALIFLWGAEAGGVTAGACAALLVLGNHLFHTLSTLCMTDGLVVAFTTGAVYAIYADPWLETRAGLWGFAGATAAAILTKGIAGVFPVGVLGLYWLCARPKERPSWKRALLAAGLAIALAAPWFVYQLAAHPRWFWREHIAVEILGFGTGAPPQTSRENPVVFYLLRMAATDPILFAAAIVAVPAFARTLRNREAGPTLLACWLALTAAATLAWQYRNASYLLAVVPAVALMAACYGPYSERRHAHWMLAAVCGALLLKAALPDAPWGLRYRGTVQPLAPALSKYSEAKRGRQLIVVDLVDDLFATTLPIPAPRYALVGPPPAAGAYGMPFADMGILVSTAQYENLEKLRPGFRSQLRAWDVDSDEPVASLIRAASAEELGRLVRGSPREDFLVPERYREALSDSGHVEAEATPGYFFLLATK